MVFKVVFSEIVVIGFAVFTPAHDFAFGVVASVKLVLLLVPGQGQPVTFTLLAEASDTPFAVVATADTGYKPWWLPMLILFAPVCGLIYDPSTW